MGIALKGELSPRVRMAARLYATGAAKTKKEASSLAGIHPNYLTMLTQPNGGTEAVKRLISDTDRMIEDESIDESVIIRKLGRKAIAHIARLMDTSTNEHVSLKAAVDLADRSPVTAKTQKHEFTGLTLSGADVKELAAAMVESGRASPIQAEVMRSGLIEVDDVKRLLAEREKPKDETSDKVGDGGVL